MPIGGLPNELVVAAPPVVLVTPLPEAVPEATDEEDDDEAVPLLLLLPFACVGDDVGEWAPLLGGKPDGSSFVWVDDC